MATQDAPLTAAALRDAERVTMLSTPESVLMDRAAAAIADECGERSPAVLLVGRGNNGGDALLAGALLAQRGSVVTAVLLAPHAHDRGLAHLAEAGGRVIEWAVNEPSARWAIGEAELIIDGISGLRGGAGLREPAASAAGAITPGSHVVAVDLPSGLDPDSGTADGVHIVADVTVTFTAPKPCLVLQPAAASAGRVVIVDVGIVLWWLRRGVISARATPAARASPACARLS